MKLFWEILEFIFGNKNDSIPITPPMTPDIVNSPTNSERLYDLAKSCMGKDIAKTQNELGCAEAVSYLLKNIQLANFPPKGFLSTADLYYWLKKYATQLDVSETGCVIISPTGFSANLHGHVGIVANHGILSNNSMTGLFDEYYTLPKWEAYYKVKLGFPIFYFRV